MDIYSLKAETLDFLYILSESRPKRHQKELSSRRTHGPEQTASLLLIFSSDSALWHNPAFLQLFDFLCLASDFGNSPNIGNSISMFAA